VGLTAFILVSKLNLKMTLETKEHGKEKKLFFLPLGPTPFPFPLSRWPNIGMFPPFFGFGPRSRFPSRVG
jgi:hypothetical protein